MILVAATATFYSDHLDFYNRRFSTSLFFLKILAGLKIKTIFADPNREIGERRRNRKNELYRSLDWLKKLENSFGSLENIFYFCNPKSREMGSAGDRD